MNSEDEEQDEVADEGEHVDAAEDEVKDGSMDVAGCADAEA